MTGRLYKPTEVADLLNVKVSTVYRWLRDGELASFRRGSRFTRVSEAHIEAFLGRHEVKASR